MALLRSLRPFVRTRNTAVLLALLFGSGCVIVTGNELSPFSRRPQPLEEHIVSGHGKERILLIDISGPITSESAPSAFGLPRRESSVALLEASLDKAAEDSRVKAVVLRINSPGGTVTASDIIYTRLMRFKEDSGLPVIAEIMDIGASGAYYSALAADAIIANPTSIVGSIGVIFQSVSLAGLLDKIGVSDQSVATGDMKDLGSPLGRMSDEERQVIEGLIGEMQLRFVSLVRERRPVLTDEMEELMQDGRIFTAQQALDGGLIDAIDYLEASIERAKKAAGVESASVIVYRQPGELARNVYSHTPTGPPQVNLINLDWAESAPSPRFLYQWIP
jgi:protease-4